MGFARIACTLLATVVGLSVVHGEDFLPVVGDLGSIAICDPNDGEECEFCVKEEEENEEENGDVVDPSKTALCLDQCARNGYIIEQLNMTRQVKDDDEGNLETMWQIKIVPTVACTAGCGCPVAIGLAAQGEVNDEGGYELPEEYELAFLDMDNEPHPSFQEGRFKVNYDDDDATKINHIEWELQYFTTVINDEGEEKLERENCRLSYKIASGKVGGIVAASGDPAPALPQIPQSDEIGMLVMDESDTEDCSSFAMLDEFGKPNPDWCTYTCAKKYSVGTRNNTVMFVPESGFVNHECKCPWGVGFQNGTGVEFEQAQISFSTEGDVCTTYYEGNISYAIRQNEDFGNAFTVSHAMTKSGKECTYSYHVTGQVMGFQGSSSAGHHDPTDLPSKGLVTFAIILSVAVLIGFCAPNFVGSKTDSN